MDRLDIIGLQAARAGGGEPTFDDQPLVPGVHLRWSFAAELGFPPYGFWLYRRIAADGERRIPLPDGDWQAGGRRSQMSDQPLPWRPGRYEWHARTPETCHCVLIRGTAAARVGEVTVETCAHLTDNRVVVTGAARVAVGADRTFETLVRGTSITAVRVTGARAVAGCDCCVVDPPAAATDGGSVAGGGLAAPATNGIAAGPTDLPGAGRKPEWGPHDRNGWQRWSAPFTLPVTRANWPARYLGAPDPLTASPTSLRNADVAEAVRRLLGAQLGGTPAATRAQLRSLRAYLDELVRDWPATLLNDVGLPAAEDGPAAPSLEISRVEHLLLSALNPHIARVLGLAWVDQTAKPGTLYDYTIVGVWGATPTSIEYLYLGTAPAAQLARGWTRIGGAVISAAGGEPPPPAGAAPSAPPVLSSRLSRSVSDGAGGWRTDPTAPFTDAWTLERAVSDTPAWDVPEALLAASTLGGAPGLVAAIDLRRPESTVEIQLAGAGEVVALYAAPGEPSTIVAWATFDTRRSGPPILGFLQDPGALSWVTLDAPDPTHAPITRLEVRAAGGDPVVVGAVRLHLLTGDVIGMRHATKQAADSVKKPPAPASCVTLFRYRQALVDEASTALRSASLYDVQWPRATPSVVVGDAGYGALQLPAPDVPVGYVVERRDGRRGPWARLSRVVASSAQSASAEAPNGVLRLSDARLPDPSRGWSHRVAAFELFGARGPFCDPSAPIGVDLTPAAPSALSVARFDNSSAGGGHDGGGVWTGATLVVDASWSGGARVAFPDSRTARVIVTPVVGQAPDGRPLDGPAISEIDLEVPPAKITVTHVTGIAVAGSSAEVLLANPLPMPDLGALGSPPIGSVPAGLLILAGDRYPDGAESFPVYPEPATPRRVSVPAGSRSALLTSSARFHGQPAYYIQPTVARASFAALPLEVPADATTARGRARALASTRTPFAPGEQLVDPNTGTGRPLPESPSVTFAGRQWLTPPAPPVPVHPVDHVYYGPADVHGLAGRKIAELSPDALPGIHHYVLARAPVEVAAVADLSRRRAEHELGSPAGVPTGVDDPAELEAWEQAATEWLAAWNQRHNTAETAADALENPDIRIAFASHFFGGLRDEELRAYADLGENRGAFAQIGTLQLPADEQAVTAFLTDEVDGSGFGRFLYRLTARNAAGSATPADECTGPFTARLSAAPAAPAQARAEVAAGGGVDLKWPLAGGPEVAGYLVFRAGTREELGDLRWYGKDPLRPKPAGQLERLIWDPTSTPHLVRVGAADPADEDPRLTAVVDDPRLIARDFNRWDRQPPHDLVAGADIPAAHRFDASDLAVVTLPAAPAVDEVIAVYRFDEYDGGNPLLQRAFNYWRPPPNGICQLTPDGGRLEGLRVGLGEAVPVVIVVSSNGAATALGTMRPTGADPPRRIVSWHDPSGAAGDWYSVVSVDIAANRSSPTTPVIAG